MEDADIACDLEPDEKTKPIKPTGARSQHIVRNHISQKIEDHIGKRTKRDDKSSSESYLKRYANRKAQQSAGSSSASPNNEVLTIHVYDAESSTEIAFKVRPTTSLHRVWDAYTQQVKRSNVELYYKGNIVALDQTPRSLSMRNNDIIYAQPGEIKLTIHVINCTSGKVSRFLVKPSTKFDKVFNAYANREGVSLQSIKFCLNGETVPDFATPSLLEMINEDAIFVHQQSSLW
jgi:hypothetical protein